MASCGRGWAAWAKRPDQGRTLSCRPETPWTSPQLRRAPSAAGLYHRPMTREAYYDHRAPEYDDFWERRGRYEHDRADWVAERDAVLELVGTLPPARTLDVACGTGYVTRRLRGQASTSGSSPPPGC